MTGELEMHEFWEELEGFLRRSDYTGPVTLHCDHGVVKEYEAVIKRKPRSGPVDLMESKRRDLTGRQE